MDIVPIWKDLYYETSGSSVQYRVRHQGLYEIFRGRAVKSPAESVIRIKLNDCCSSYLNSLLGAETLQGALSLDTLEKQEAYGEFSLDIYDTSEGEWETVLEWAFVNDYSYEERYYQQGPINVPINGHTAADQLLPCSYLVTASAATVCYNSSSLYFVITSGQSVEKSWNGGNWTIRFDTNIDSIYYVFDNGEEIGYLNGPRQISFNLPGNNTYFDREYSVRFFNEPGGVLLGEAICTVISAQKPIDGSASISIISYDETVPATQNFFNIRFSNSDQGSITREVYSSSTEDGPWSLVNSRNIIYQGGEHGNSITIGQNSAGTARYFKVIYYYTNIPTIADEAYIMQNPLYWINITGVDPELPAASSTAVTVVFGNSHDGTINYSLYSSMTQGAGWQLIGTASGYKTAAAYHTVRFNIGNNTQNSPRYFRVVLEYADYPGSDVAYFTQQMVPYEEQYLTLEILSGGTIDFGHGAYEFTKRIISYSKNGGAWNEVTSYSGDSNYFHINVSAGDKIRLKGFTSGYTGSADGQFTDSTAVFNVYGNLLSLYYGDDFKYETSIPVIVEHGYDSQPTLMAFFEGAKVVSAENLKFPPGPLPERGSGAIYEAMFRDCTYLTTAPKVIQGGVSRSVNELCRKMFYGCTALITPPERITFGDNADFREMFMGCISLTTAPQFVLTGESYYFQEAFSDCTLLTTAPLFTVGGANFTKTFVGCTSLVTAGGVSGKTIAAKQMFSGCTSLTSVNTIQMERASDCTEMFFGCTSLVNVPAVLPATDLREGCYAYMFRDCTSLTKGPDLPATLVPDSAYRGMFYYCTNLVTSPVISATTVGERGCEMMFEHCTSLTTAPILRATTIGVRCYDNMFAYCTSLVSAPSMLPALVLAERCYNSMFAACTSLTTAPSLPATTLAVDCYNGMFRACSALTTPPSLPAPTLVERCYYLMFQNCSLLDNLTCLAVDVSATECTKQWLYGVSQTGTFTKARNADYWVTGYNGIPNGWTIQNAQ